MGERTAGRYRTGFTTAASGVLLAALAGCSALGGSAGSVTTSAPAPIPVVTKPIPVLTIATPKPRTPAPTLKTTGAAWPAILTSLSAYGQWILANPDPAQIANIAEPGCAMYNLISRQAAGLLGDRAYLKPKPPAFGTVVGPSPAPGSTAAALGGAVTLDVTASRPQEAVLSRNGAKQIMVFDALPATGLQITLYRGTDSKWRFCTVDATADSGVPDDPSMPLF